MQKTEKVWIAMVVLIAMCSIVSGATVTPSITYQGKLTDTSGNPLTGTYDITFNLYDASSGGTLLATDTHSVDASGGLFTTQITADLIPTPFNGQELWLGIAVGSDPEMTPRQEIRPVPYALSLRPNALITSVDDSSPALTLKNTGGGNALDLSTTGYANFGLNVSIMGDNTAGVRVRNDGTYDGRGIFVQTLGKSSKGVDVLTFGEDSPAVYARTIDKFSNAFEGDTVENYSYGIKARTSGYKSHGALLTTTGDYADGVLIGTSGPHSYGVEIGTTGRYGRGVVVESQNYKGDAFLAITHGEYAEGLQALTYGDNSNGVDVTTEGVSSRGVNVTTTGSHGEGVSVITSGSYAHGVTGQTSGLAAYAVKAITTGPSAVGVDAYSEQSYAIQATTGRSDHKWGLYTNDYIYAGGIQAPAVDVAEYMPVTGDTAPGTVLIIADDGTLEPAATAYDTRVAGIVSTDPAVSLGAKDTGNPGESPIAVAGRVPCRVDASYGAIHAGDLLTTSDTPGYAMKAADPKIGTVLGKAMGTLESGTGTIEVLVTLQ